MAIQLGSAYGKVNIDASGVKSGVDTAKKSFGSLEESAKKLGVTLQNVGKAMTVAVSIPLALLAKDAVMLSSAYEESLNKVNVVFEENGRIIAEWSKDAAKNLGMSQAAALAAAGVFGNLFTAQGMGTKSASDMSMALVQLSADLASFNDASPEEVLLALRSGLSGEIEPLKRFGIALNEALMKAKAMEMGLGDNIQALTEAEKIQVRYAIILEQTAKAQGDFARTSQGLANLLRTLKGAWGDTLKILGDQLRPLIIILVQHLIKLLEWFNKLPKGTQEFIGKLLLLAIVAGPLLFIFGKLLPLAFSGATKSMNPFSGGIFGLIGTIIKWVGIAATIVKVLGALGIATGPVGAGIVAVSTAIGGAAATFLGAVVLPILVIIATLGFLYWAFKNNFMGITTTLQQAAFIVDVWIKDTSAAFNKWVDDIAMIFTNWVDGVKAKFDMFVNTVKERFNKVVNIFKGIGITVNQIGKIFHMIFVDGISRAIDWVVSKIDKLKAALANIKLPPALTPGSPTPFEVGLRGIGSAMDDLSKKGFPNLQASMAYAANSNDMAHAMARPMQNNNSSSTITTSTVNHFSNGLTLRDVDAMMDDKINRFARRAMGKG